MAGLIDSLLQRYIHAFCEGLQTFKIVFGRRVKQSLDLLDGEPPTLLAA
jgi:hypothetical protein